jgi:hypothetical protein
LTGQAKKLVWFKDQCFDFFFRSGAPVIAENYLSFIAGSSG